MPHTAEVWKIVPNYLYYEVSSLGRVRSVARSFVDASGRVYAHKARLLAGTFTTSMGWVVDLAKADKSRKSLVVARLVLSAFVRLPEVGEVARHLNDNKDDNRLENLAWGSHQDNVADGVKNGRYRKLPHHKCVKLTEEQVKQAKLRYVARSRTDGASAIARELRVHESAVYNAIHGNTWAHLV